MNNGEDAAGDGGPLTLKGKVYAKGLGVHADSGISYYLGGACTTFTAAVGIDDAKLPKTHRGNVVFTVVGDGKVLGASPQLTVDSALYNFNVDVTGVNYIELNAAKIMVDGKNGDEWSDWADARFSCGIAVPALTLAPVVEGGSAIEQGTTHKVTVAELKAGSPASLTLAGGKAVTATADASGVAAFSLAVPADAKVGAAALLVTGTDKNGKAATGTLTVTVTQKPVPVELTISVPGGSLQIGAESTVTVGKLKAGAKATVALAGKELGKATADSNGVATFKVTLAAGTATGNAALSASGTGSNGLAATGSSNVVITAAAVDPGGPEAVPLVPSLNVPSDSLTAGGKLTITVPDLAPGSTLRVELHSTPVVLGTAKANDSGVATLTVTIPANTRAGDHQIALFGTDANGTDSTGFLAVTVAKAPVDPTDPPVDPAPGATPTAKPGTTPSASASASAQATSEPAGDGTSNGSGNNGDELPNTGANAILPILGLGLLALFGGAATMLVRRRRSHG